MLQHAAAKPLEDEGVPQEIIMWSRELAMLRGTDHEAACLKMELELHVRQQAATEMEDEANAKISKKWGPLRELMADFGWDAGFRKMTQNCPPELVKSCRD